MGKKQFYVDQQDLEYYYEAATNIKQNELENLGNFSWDLTWLRANIFDYQKELKLLAYAVKLHSGKVVSYSVGVMWKDANINTVLKISHHFICNIAFSNQYTCRKMSDNELINFSCKLAYINHNGEIFVYEVLVPGGDNIKDDKKCKCIPLNYYKYECEMIKYDKNYLMRHHKIKWYSDKENKQSLFVAIVKKLDVLNPNDNGDASKLNFDELETIYFGLRYDVFNNPRASYLLSHSYNIQDFLLLSNSSILALLCDGHVHFYSYPKLEWNSKSLNVLNTSLIYVYKDYVLTISFGHTEFKLRKIDFARDLGEECIHTLKLYTLKTKINSDFELQSRFDSNTGVLVISHMSERSIYIISVAIYHGGPKFVSVHHSFVAQDIIDFAIQKITFQPLDMGNEEKDINDIPPSIKPTLFSPKVDKLVTYKANLKLITFQTDDVNNTYRSASVHSLEFAYEVEYPEQHILNSPCVVKIYSNLSNGKENGLKTVQVGVNTSICDKTTLSTPGDVACMGETLKIEITEHAQTEPPSKISEILTTTRNEEVLNISNKSLLDKASDEKSGYEFTTSYTDTVETFQKCSLLRKLTLGIVANMEKKLDTCNTELSTFAFLKEALSRLDSQDRVMVKAQVESIISKISKKLDKWSKIGLE